MKRSSKFSHFKGEIIEEVVRTHHRETKKKTVFIGTYGTEGHFMSVNFPGNSSEQDIFGALSIPNNAHIQIYTSGDNTDTVYCDPDRVFEADSPEKALSTVLNNYDLLLH